ncbi:hypothetical protein Tco_0402009 [Tanacetum coccineum]
MTRSSTKELFTPYEEPERVLHSTRKLFKKTSHDYPSSPEFDLFSDLEDQCEEKVIEAMGEPTMEEYMTITRKDYGLRIARPMINGKARIELKVDSLNVPNVTHDRLRLSVFLISLTGAASKWLKDESIGSITIWDYWRRRYDEEIITDGELSNLRYDNLIEDNEAAQIFRINTNIFHFKTPLCKAIKVFNYLSQIDVDVLTNDILGFKTYEEYKDDWIYG